MGARSDPEARNSARMGGQSGGSVASGAEPVDWLRVTRFGKLGVCSGGLGFHCTVAGDVCLCATCKRR